jgi:hypothetical protein
MKKIPSVFQRNYETDRLCRDEVVPGCEWVLAGEGTATYKWDGTSCMVRDGKLYRRYDAKHGKTPPPGFEPCQEPDTKTGHWPGWVPVAEDTKKLHFKVAIMLAAGLDDGAYELIGPKVNGNPHGAVCHVLMPHGGCGPIRVAPTYDGIRDYLSALHSEGIVFHHPDGRMAKVKRKDFGFAWPVPRTEFP